MTSTTNLRTPQELEKCLLPYAKRPDPAQTIAGLEHRQNLIKIWNIPPGSRVLELGCGQGDFTVALADAVGTSGRVVGLDPASKDFGTPPLGDAQTHVLASPVGSIIEFVQAESFAYLDSSTESFDFIVLGHSTWFFSDPAILPEMLTRASRFGKDGTKVLIASFALAATRPVAVPHVLAALALNALESFRGEESWRNIRCALSPRQVVDSALGAGWKVLQEKTVEAAEGQREGFHEVRMMLHLEAISPITTFEHDVDALDVGVKIKSMLFGMRDAVAASVDRLEGGLESVKTMQVWVGSFEFTGNRSDTSKS